MRTVNFLLAIMFLGFAFLQVNDPDPILWILIYGAMAMVCIMAMFRVYYKSVLTILAVAYIVYCIILWPGVNTWLQQDRLSVLFEEGMKMQHMYIEEAREFLGLVICLVVLGVYLFQSFKTK
jgi:hypothetical protein